MPQLSSGLAAVEDDLGLVLRPVEGAAQLVGYGGKLFRGEAAALGQGLAATHTGPETAVGKAIVRFGAAEVVGELALGDMGDHAEVRAGGVEELGPVVRGKVAAVPGAAEQGGELAGALAEHMEHGGELLSEEEEASIGGGLLITQSVDDAVGCGAGGGYAARDPTRVSFGEEAGDLTPAGSFAGLAGFADQYDEEVEAVPGGADGAVRRGADKVAEGGEELQEDSSGIGLGVKREAADSEPGKTVEGWFGERERRGRGGLRGGIFDGVGFFGVFGFFELFGCFEFLGKTGLFFKAGVFGGERLFGRRGGLRLPPAGLVGKQLTTAALYVGE